MLVLKELQRQNQIYSTLRDRIIFVDYEPGRPISENKMAKEFGCSRVPVREALILLKVEGLVTVVANQGSYVSRVDLSYLKNNFMIRSKLVKILGKLAAENITEEQMGELKSIVNSMEEESNYKDLMRLDYQFHRVLHEASDNEWLSGILDMLLGHAVRSWIINSAPGENLSGPFIPTNFTELTEALEAGDVEKSANLLVDHVQFSLKSLDQFMEGLNTL
ncbi:GntR family transcriptional regulator [Candidatus Bipolaricaulota bacterium]|nr:GntR family transcriptional regulator [Candidatus Bipolaricaulota bacterium]